MMKLSSLLVALLVVGCGKKANEKSNAPVKPSEVSATKLSQNPLPLNSNKMKSACSVEKYEEAQKNFNLSLFLRGEEVQEERMFSGLIDGLFVRDIGSKIITESHKGESIVYTYTSTDDVITGDKKLISSPSIISICPDKERYEKGTAESAALNATFYISKVNKKVSELLPSVVIPTVTIEISPMIKKALSVVIKGEVVWSYEAFETDNAYYMPGNNSITFLPHSEEFRKSGMTFSFWEVPMVAAHEYGHHIFQTLNPGPTHAPGLKSCFGKFHVEGDTETESEKRIVSNDDVLGALNEGFADLVSFYSLENNERGLKGVNCLQISRDVGSKVFADGKPKIFNSEVLTSFFSDKAEPQAESCDVSNFQGIHILGAVFAHGADRLLSLSTDTKDQRLAIVLNWLQEMKNRSAVMNTLKPQDFLLESFKLFIEVTVARTDSKLDQAECDLLKEIYPGIDGSLSACMPPI